MKLHRVMYGHRRSGLRAAALATAAAAALLMAPGSRAAEPAASGGGAKSKVMTLEQVPGGGPPRVILVPKAAERLGIATGKIEERTVPRRQMVGGLVVPASEGLKPPPILMSGSFGAAGSFGTSDPGPGSGSGTSVTTVSAAAPAQQDGAAYIVVMLSQAEIDRLDMRAPARIVTLSGRGDGTDLEAHPSGLPPIEDAKRSMLGVRYVVPGGKHGLTPNQRVRVELTLQQDGESHKVVPYGAVHYDGKGAAWVYANPKPLTFERQRIEVDRIVGDLAVLKSGPPVGTPVVTVGAAMLHGAEVFRK